MDQTLFLVINHLPHTEFTNAVAMFLSGIGQWGLVWFVLAILLFFREEKRDHWFFLPSILAMGASYILSELVFKNLIARPRPLGAYLSDFSFPSTHATIAFALAFVLSKEEPKYTFWFYALAVCISLSRIYLGVHYPTDVIGGTLLGWGIGWIAVAIKKTVPHGKKTKTQQKLH